MTNDSESATATIDEVEHEPSKTKTVAKPDEKTKRKVQPPYAVILHNDDVNGFDYVVAVLRKVFNYDRAKARKLTLEAHEKGRSIVWSGQLEHAELKADQIRSCGPDPIMKARGALALKVTVEPLPG
jgi:ATP-dependent Clp protease adaptor protein ClpS